MKKVGNYYFSKFVPATNHLYAGISVSSSYEEYKSKKSKDKLWIVIFDENKDNMTIYFPSQIEFLKENYDKMYSNNSFKTMDEVKERLEEFLDKLSGLIAFI